MTLHGGNGKTHIGKEWVYWGIDRNSTWEILPPVSRTSQPGVRIILHRMRETAPDKQTPWGERISQRRRLLCRESVQIRPTKVGMLWSGNWTIRTIKHYSVLHKGSPKDPAARQTSDLTFYKRFDILPLSADQSCREYYLNIRPYNAMSTNISPMAVDETAWRAYHEASPA